MSFIETFLGNMGYIHNEEAKRRIQQALKEADKNREVEDEQRKKNSAEVLYLEVLRYSSQKESTLGILFDVSIGREFLCYTIEDEFRTKKVMGETRIPVGSYNVTLRKTGGFHNRYQKKYPGMHQGMLWVQGVPNFKYVLIHVGNDDDDTAGCLLLGNTAVQNLTDEGRIGGSIKAYSRVYPYILQEMSLGKKVMIRYINYDTV